MTRGGPNGKRRRRPQPNTWSASRTKRRDNVTGIVLLSLLLGGTSGVIAVGLSSGGAPKHPATSTSSVSTSITASSNDRIAQQWSTAITTDFGPMDSVLQSLLQAIDSWESGSKSSSSVAAEIELDWPDLYATRTSLAKQTPLLLAPEALDNYRMSVVLYIESIRLAAVAAVLPAGPLLHQLQLSSTRIRELGDRVYDQATVDLSSYVPATPSGPDLEVITPPDVPLWASISLAPGPPLDATAKPAAPILYQKSRPQESFTEWQNQVDATRIPSAAAEASAIDSGTTPELRKESEAFNQACITLTAQPDPLGDRQASTRLRLGLLVDAEATRAAEAATLDPSTQVQSKLREIAQTLALVGDDLWDGDLGLRSTRFAASLLST